MFYRLPEFRGKKRSVLLITEYAVEINRFPVGMKGMKKKEF